jgi:LPS export ABC transporter protein LptC
MVLLGLKKNKKLSIFLILVMLVAIGVIVTVFVGYRRVATAPEQLLSSIKDGANLSLGKIRQTATRDGIKEWSLEAGSAHYIENDKKAVLKDLSIIYFLKDHHEVHLKAEEGILRTDTNDIEFSGNVVIRNEDYQLRTNRLSYKHEQRVIYSNDPVRVSGESVTLAAKSLNYDLNLNKITLTGDVEAAISRDFAALNHIGTRRQ